MADSLAVAALASGAALLFLVVVLVVVLRRRDPVGHGVAGYAGALQALRETSARATSVPPAPQSSRDSPPTVSVITSTDKGGEGDT